VANHRRQLVRAAPTMAGAFASGVIFKINPGLEHLLVRVQPSTKTNGWLHRRYANAVYRWQIYGNDRLWRSVNLGVVYSFDRNLKPSRPRFSRFSQGGGRLVNCFGQDSKGQPLCSLLNGTRFKCQG